MKKHSLQFLFAIVLATGCKENFEPPVISESISALVVDGFLNNSSDTTFIRLSRTKKLSQGVRNAQEKGALLSIRDAGGNTLYIFQELNDSGTYIVPGMNLDINNKYRLSIITANSKQYLSDEIAVIKTPPIDSISFANTGNGVIIYANTHDPRNNTRYYRWEFTEVWKYHAAFFSELIFENERLRNRTQDEYIYDCWRTQQSTQLLLGSSVKLAEDIIYHFPLRKIEQNSVELSVKYFIHLKQYGLTKESFEYLESLKKITEQSGSIFDPQPSQVSSNMHAVNSTNEPVLGYITASTAESKELYITNDEVKPWNYLQPCEVSRIPLDMIIAILRTGNFSPISQEGIGPQAKILVSEPHCVDCTMRGGITTKPDFWQ